MSYTSDLERRVDEMLGLTPQFRASARRMESASSRFQKAPASPTKANVTAERNDLRMDSSPKSRSGARAIAGGSSKSTVSERAAEAALSPPRRTKPSWDTAAPSSPKHSAAPPVKVRTSPSPAAPSPVSRPRTAAPSRAESSASPVASRSMSGGRQRSPSEEDRVAIRARRAAKEAENSPLKLWEKINEKPCSEIVPGFLYVAGESNATCMDVTQRRYGFEQFTHVLSLRGTVHRSPFIATVDALPIAVGDANNQNLKQHFDRCYRWIEQAQCSTEPCHMLVHCKHGVSRSGAVVLYYIMRKQRCSLRDALIFVKKGRKDICPNRGFFMQLQECEMDMFGQDKPSVNAVEARKNMWCSVTKFQENITEADIRGRRYSIEWESALIEGAEKSW